MNEIREVTIPELGDIDEVDVVEVLVAGGDRVARDDSLISLESDKATMDVPAPFAGTVQEVKVKAGDKVREGSVILTLEVMADSDEQEEPTEAEPEPEPAPTTAQPPAPEPDPKQQEEATGERASSDTELAPAADERAPSQRLAEATRPAPASEVDGAPVAPDFSKVYASPAIRRFARELGVDLTRVRGSGRKARILREDVEQFVKETLSRPAAGPGAAPAQVPVIDFSKFGEIERQPLTRVQKISGPSLSRSWLTIPHVTQHDESDITELEAFRQEHRARAKEHGFSLTPLAFVMKAVVAALQEYPRVNASLEADGEHLVVKKYYHLGVAVDTPEGLVVPVIRNVDRKGVFELARELAEVSARARDRKLTPNEIRGASFTVSSLGGIGGKFFTPIVNWPEVAILGVSRSRTEPVWDGEAFRPRLILPLSLSYDHRVIDGAMAVRFTTYLARVLSDIRRLIL